MAEAAPAASPHPSGVELAAYDCQSCHHELTVDSWRQTPGFRAHPGRPAPRSWPLAFGKPPILAKIGLAAAGNDGATIAADLKSLDDALSDRPFGDLG